MFGHKSSNKTTVGTATVQSPSMLDNVSTQDFSGGDAPEDIQQRVQDALTQHEMKKMEIIEPSSGGFMASPMPATSQPSQTVASDIVTSSSTAPSSPPPVTSQEPFNVASLEAPTVPSPSLHDQDGSIPRPLTPEEDKQAVIDAANAPTPVTAPAPAAVSAPVEPPPVSAPVSGSGFGSSVDGNDDQASATATPTVALTSEDANSASTTNSDATTAASPSAPIEPPAPPPTVDLHSSSSADSGAETAPEAAADDETDVVAASEPEQDNQAAAETTTGGESTEDTPADSPSTTRSTSGSDLNADVETETDTDAADSTDSEGSEDEAKEDEDTTPTSSVISSSSIPAIDTSKLAALKQHALDHLEPLADKLDQSPEEEFRTTMMRIQANDNHTLLEKALNAAKKIEDGSARAKALLDIINEINYFAQVSDDIETSQAYQPDQAE